MLNTTMTFNYERSDVIFDNLIRYQLLGLCDVSADTEGIQASAVS